MIRLDQLGFCGWIGFLIALTIVALCLVGIAQAIFSRRRTSDVVARVDRVKAKHCPRCGWKVETTIADPVQNAIADAIKSGRAVKYEKRGTTSKGPQ